MLSLIFPKLLRVKNTYIEATEVCKLSEVQVNHSYNCQALTTVKWMLHFIMIESEI